MPQLQTTEVGYPSGKTEDGQAAHEEGEGEEGMKLEQFQRRGYGLKGLSNERSKQCRWCGMWLRVVRYRGTGGQAA
jgi:hypothetical protein